MNNTIDTTTKYYIGDSLPHKWSSVYNYRPQSAEMLAKRGEIFAVFSLYSAEGFNAVTAGNLLVDYFHEVYFESKKTGILECVIAGINSVRERLAELLEHEEDAAANGVDLNISVMVVRNEEVYYATFGSGKILLLTNGTSGKILDISAALRDPFAKGTVKIGSSLAMPDQRYLLATETGVNELEVSEQLSVLSGFSDLRLKNKDYDKPEEAAFLLIGLDIRKKEHGLTDAADNPSIIQSLSGAPAEPAELLEEVENQPPAETTFQDVQEHEEELTDDFPTNEVQIGAEDILEAEVEQSLLSKLTDQVKSLPQLMRKRAEDMKKQREMSKLQNLRAEAATGPSDPFANGSSVTTGNLLARSRSERLSSNAEESTFQSFLRGIGAQVARLRDILLYDLLKINHRKSFQMGRTQDGKFGLTLLGLTLNQNILIGLAVILLLFLGFSLVSADSQRRERENRVLAAAEQLDLIEKDLRDVEANPVLNAQSFADIPQRQELLAELLTIEEKFAADFSVLPESEVNSAHEKLETLRQRVLKVRRPQLNILLDVANVFQGQVQSLVRTGENIYVLDKSKGSIYRQPTGGGTPVLLSEGLVNPEEIAADANGNLIVYENNEGNVLSIINPANKEKFSVAGISGTNLPAPSGLTVFDATNALYATSSGSNRILQMNRRGREYALPSTRHVEEGANSLLDVQIINRQIFALAVGTGIVRVGNPTAGVEAFPEVLEGMKQAMAMSYDDEFIYTLDAQAKKLYVFTISRGSQAISDFVAQVDLSQIEGELKAIAVDKPRGVVLVADTTKLYSFSHSELTR